MSGEHRFRDYVNWPSPRDVLDSTQVHAHSFSVEAKSDADLEGSEQQQRLADILDEYLQNLENGTPDEIDALVGRHPDLAQPLREFLDGFDVLQAGIFDLASPELAARSPSLKRGRLGDYDIIREVGRGGMGVVYEAQQVSLDRRVALKVLPFASMLDKRQIVRFENEARAAAQLHHAHIVPVYGVGCDRGVHYFAMQFIDGQSARELIDARREQLNVDDHERSSTSDTTLRSSSRLTRSHSSLSRSTSRQQIDQIARLGTQAASAMHTAHQCGVVHRDIKPSNVMLDADGDLWITDFGLARCQADSNVTRSGDILGTLHYMSPEQARGDGAVADPRSDIYSLGVTLYEMLTLERPFEANTHSEVIKQIEFGRCKSVRHWNPRVPHDLENVIAKAMAPDPSDRYRNAKELEEDLQRFVDQKATRAKPPSKTRLLSRWAARNRGVVVSAVTALCVMCATLFVATFWLATEQAALTFQHEKANRKLTTTEQTLENFGLAMAERLKQIPGSEPVRQSLLSDLLEHYQTLLAESSDTPSLRANRAVTSTKIANIYRESGNRDSAIRAFRAAQSDFRRLRDDVAELAANEEKHAYTSQLATCLSNASVVLQELGKVDEATAEIDEAILLQEGLVRARDELRDQFALATSYAHRGTIECDRDPRTGVECLMKAAEIAEQAQSLVTDAETRVDALRTLAAIYGNLSSRLRDTDLSDAVEYGRRAVDCTRRMVEFDSQRQEFRTMLATNCNNLATLHVQNQEPDRAIQLYRDAARQLRATNDPSLVVTLGNLAKVQNRMGLLVGATESYGEAIAVQADLLRESPGNLNHVSRLGGLQNNLAFVCQRNGQLGKACTAYKAAIEYQRRAFELAPPHVNAYRDALSRTYFNASRAELAQGQLLRAAELQRRRGELWPRDSGQLFSVAASLGTIVRQIPSSGDQHNWRKLGLSTLRSALDVDSDELIDPRQAAELARLLQADKHEASEAKVGSNQL